MPVVQKQIVGERIRSFADDKIVNSSVSRIYKSRRDYYFELIAEDYSVRVTAEHPFYEGDGEFREVKDLVVGEMVYVEESGRLTPKRVTSKTRVDERTDVYNVMVDSTKLITATSPPCRHCADISAA